jgi:hypothetical protein
MVAWVAARAITETGALNDKGIETRRGGKWSSVSVMRLLERM